ncbi:MAG: YbhB/YbcL family Raf kinase inhibitor-like protein [Angelakisella sp.]|nr:YbhB/YbcL family Raf kinase inhibitor-like protein [Angelakisella sp.]
MLTLHSPAFLEGGIIPTRHTGRGEDLSPPFTAKGIPEGSVSLSILLEDTSHPLFRDFPHWLIWNLPVAEHIPEGIAPGGAVEVLGCTASQGTAYGPRRYAGPKPPRWRRHLYRFTLLALDCRLELPPSTGKRRFLEVAEEHILERATLSGWFPRTGKSR